MTRFVSEVKDMWNWSLYVWHYRLTEGGRCLLLAIFCSGMAAAVSLEIPIYHLFISLTCLYGISWLASFFLRPRLRIQGVFPEKVVENISFVVCFQLENLSPKTLYDVGVGFFGLPQVFQIERQSLIIPVLPAKGKTELKLTVSPLRRGWYQLPRALIYTCFPFHLRRTGEIFHSLGTVTVWPSFHPLKSVNVPLRSRYQPGGLAFGARAGNSPEYIGNREYRPGDSAKRIDFRSWARLSRPVVKEYQEEYYCRVGLVLDTFGRQKKGICPELEAAVSLSAAIAEFLCQRDYVVDLFVAGAEVYRVRAGRSTGQLSQIMDALACLQLSRRNPFLKVLPVLSEECPLMSGVIFILLGWDETRYKMVHLAEEAGCEVRVVLVGRNFSGEFSGLAGDLLQVTAEQIKNGQVDRI